MSSHPSALRQAEKVPFSLRSACFSAKPAKQLRYRSFQRLWLVVLNVPIKDPNLRQAYIWNIISSTPYCTWSR